MSIIYDALKKIEGFHTGDSKDKINQKSGSSPGHKVKVYLIYVLCASLGFLITGIFFRIISRIPKNQVQVPPQSPTEAPLPVALSPAIIAETETQPSAPSFVLSGVFFSENKGYALINNRIVKEGDKIEGATVMRIALDEVKLELGGLIIRLSK